MVQSFGFRVVLNKHGPYLGLPNSHSTTESHLEGSAIEGHPETSIYVEVAVVSGDGSSQQA